MTELGEQHATTLTGPLLDRLPFNGPDGQKWDVLNMMHVTFVPHEQCVEWQVGFTQHVCVGQCVTCGGLWGGRGKCLVSK